MRVVRKPRFRISMGLEDAWSFRKTGHRPNRKSDYSRAREWEKRLKEES